MKDAEMKNALAGFIIGTLVTLALIALGGYIAIVNGWIPARGDEPPGTLETWAARHSLKATLEREGTAKSPISGDEADLMAGAKVYASNCASCHGTPVNEVPTFARGLNPEPTLFGNGDFVTDDPEGSIHWKAQHGIKFTGMPSFSKSLSDKEIWQVTAFLKKMDKLPAPVDSYWKSMK